MANFIVLFIINILFIQNLGTYFEYVNIGNKASYKFYANRNSLFITTTTIIFFCSMKYLFEVKKHTKIFNKIIGFISSCTFGIFLL